MIIYPLGERGGAKAIDLTGKVFGSLTVLRLVGRSAGRHFVWECRCVCGKVITVQRPALANQKSCGCLSFHILEPGERFGSLTVLSQSRPGARVHLKCDCGGEAKYMAGTLKSGRRKSCGKCSLVRLSRGVALCSTCGVEKPVGDFWVARSNRNGLNDSCIECCKLYHYSCYYSNLEMSRERSREYFHKAKRLAKPYAIAKTPNHKHAANEALHRAIKKGLLVRPSSCSQCDRSSPKFRIEAHHDDYSKPLDVVWLCSGCHKKRHVELAGKL